MLIKAWVLLVTVAVAIHLLDHLRKENKSLQFLTLVRLIPRFGSQLNFMLPLRVVLNNLTCITEKTNFDGGPMVTNIVRQLFNISAVW